MQRTIRPAARPGDIGIAYALAISLESATIAAGGWTGWMQADPQEQSDLFDRASGAMVRRIDGLHNASVQLVFATDCQYRAATPEALKLRRPLADGALVVVGRDSKRDDADVVI